MKISGKNAKKGILISKRKIGRESAKFEGKYNRKSLRGLILPSLRIEKKVLLQRGRKFSLCEDNTRLVQVSRWGNNKSGNRSEAAKLLLRFAVRFDRVLLEEKRETLVKTVAHRGLIGTRVVNIMGFKEGESIFRGEKLGEAIKSKFCSRGVINFKKVPLREFRFSSITGFLNLLL